MASFIEDVLEDFIYSCDFFTYTTPFNRVYERIDFVRPSNVCFDIKTEAHSLHEDKCMLIVDESGCLKRLSQRERLKFLKFIFYRL